MDGDKNDAEISSWNYVACPLHRILELLRILSAPPTVGTRADSQGACLSRLGGMGHLPVNRHRDCNILIRYISIKSINIL